MFNLKCLVVLLLGTLFPDLSVGLKPEFPDRPIQLVAPDEHHKGLVLVEENVKLLHGIPGPVATVAVVGKFHSGKSFLMNQLMGKAKGFGVGPSVRPETMGIWMWGKPVTMTLSTGQKASIIFLDTEGFAANNVSENYDSKIFAVATLISSHLLYNSVKIIDQADIDYLELLARRTQLFALRSQMSRAKWTDDFNHDLLKFPPLIWVVQDFVQATEEGVSPQQWLHRLMESHTRENEDYEISLLSIFSSVDCHTLFLPAVKKRLLMDLSQASEDDLTEEYKEEREDLVYKLRSNIVPKEKNSQSLSGRELATLLQILVTAANEGSLSDVPSRWTVFVERLKQTATEDCLKFYEAEMAVLDSKHNGGPVRVKDLKVWHDQSNEKSLELLKHLLHGLETAVNESKQKLSQQMALFHERAKDINEKKIRLRCSELHNKYQLKAEELLGSIQLPVPSEEISKDINKTNLRIQNEFTTELNNLVEEVQLKKNLKSLESTIGTLGQSFQLQNAKAIESILQDGIRLAVDKFKEATKGTEDGPRKPKILSIILRDGMQDSQQVFNKHCAKYEKESVFKAFLALFQSEISKLTKTMNSENEDLFKALAKHTVLQMQAMFSTNTGPTHLPLPQNKTELENRLLAEVNKVLREYKESLEEFSLYPTFNQGLEDLQSQLEKTCVGRRQENVEAFTKEVEQPLRTAKQIILLSSGSYKTVFSLKQYMTRVCLLQLNEGKPQFWSNELKNSIIDHFINSETSLQAALQSKEGVISSMLGFIQWILSWLYLF